MLSNIWDLIPWKKRTLIIPVNWLKFYLLLYKPTLQNFPDPVRVVYSLWTSSTPISTSTECGLIIITSTSYIYTTLYINPLCLTCPVLSWVTTYFPLPFLVLGPNDIPKTGFLDPFTTTVGHSDPCTFFKKGWESKTYILLTQGVSSSSYGFQRVLSSLFNPHTLCLK